MIRLDEKLPQLTKNARLTLGAVSAGNYNALAEGCKKRVDLSNVSHNGELSNVGSVHASAVRAKEDVSSLA